MDNDKLLQIIDTLSRIEQHLLSEREYNELGHRIVYDPVTGKSTNVLGDFIDPNKVDPVTGYRIKL